MFVDLLLLFKMIPRDRLDHIVSNEIKWLGANLKGPWEKACLVFLKLALLPSNNEIFKKNELSLFLFERVDTEGDKYSVDVKGCVEEFNNHLSYFSIFK